MGRNPDMTFRKLMSLGHESAAVTLDKIEAWFKGVHAFLENEFKDEHISLLTDPRRIFNADESGFPLAVKPGRVLASTGAKNVYSVVTNTKTQITVMASFNAFDEYPPPMIIFSGERIRDVGLSGFPDAIYLTTPNGWMDSAAFLEYVKQIDAFVDNKGIRKPVILFVDGHSTYIHECLETSQYCEKDHSLLSV